MSKQTPSQTIGPFFHMALLPGKENVLTDARTRGERIHITGQVLDGDGRPVPDAMIELWQADAQGIYRHSADPRHAQADPHFRGFGRCGTAQEGRFSFETIRPGAVTWDGTIAQAPHLNLRLFSRGMITHAVTRLYFADELANQNDPVLSALDPARRHTLIASREETADMPTYGFNIVLQGELETAFFTP